MVIKLLKNMALFLILRNITSLDTQNNINNLCFVNVVYFRFLWGYLCDRKGRKFAAITSALGLMVTTVVFAFSFEFYWAFFARISQGCAMGNKIYFYHVCNIIYIIK